MTLKIVGTAAAAVIALAACDTGRSDRATSMAAARSQTGMSTAAPAMGGTPMVGGAVNQAGTTVAPSTPPMPMASPYTGTTTSTMPERAMTPAERRRMALEERRASRRGAGGRMSERDSAYMGGGMVGTAGGMGAPPASALGNPSSVGGVGGSNTASTGPGGTAATGSGNQPGTGGSSQGNR